MKTTALFLCALVIGGVFGGPAARAQTIEQTTNLNDPARLEQLVAPIALYPDSMLMQVLMAATYPVEVVEAERFARENSGLSTQAAQASLVNVNWDPSVKALVGYPDVLKMMSENLDWTRDLGDAFLANQAALLDAVQRMRLRAREAGTLTTSPEQTVTVREDRIVVIEPARADVVYVPTYSPYYVYGGWSYPRWYYPRVYGWWPNPGFSFFVGSGSWAFWGSWFWGQPYWAWGGSSVFINVDSFNDFNRHHGYDWTDRDLVVRDRGDWGTWRHRPEHRRGVRYSDPVVARQFTPTAPRTRDETGRIERPRIDRAPSGVNGDALESQNRRRVESPRDDVRRTPELRSAPNRVEAPRVERPRAPAIDRRSDRARPAPNRIESPNRVESPRAERRAPEVRQRAPSRVEPPRVETRVPEVRQRAPSRVESPRVERRAPQARPAPAPRIQRQPEATRPQAPERVTPPARAERGTARSDRPSVEPQSGNRPSSSRDRSRSDKDGSDDDPRDRRRN